MINTLEYNNQNGLADFTSLFNDNTSVHNNQTHANSSNKNIFYDQQANLPQPLHQDQHTLQRNLMYTQHQQHQQQLLNNNTSNHLDYNCSNQYGNFYNQPQSSIDLNQLGTNRLPIQSGQSHSLGQNYLSALATYSITNNKEPSDNGLLNSTNNSNFSQFDSYKLSEVTKKVNYKTMHGTSQNGHIGKKEGNTEEDDEDDDEDSEDEFDEDEEEFEDDENDETNFKKTSKRPSRKNVEVDNENDYEIKHNCLTEDGAYMNTLFNSPSSLSSSSGNIDLRTKQNTNQSYQYANLTTCNILGNNISLINEANTQGIDMKNLKAEITDGIDLTKTKAQFGNQPSFSSASSSSSLSNSNEPHKIKNEHMNNMINSYSKAGIMNDHDLVNLPLRELNKRLRALPKQNAYNMKKRRRTLKNRKYAQNCRSKRLEQKSEMEIQNNHLKTEISRLNKLIDKYKNEVTTLRNIINNKNNSTSHLSDNNQRYHSDKPELTIDDAKENKSFMISNSASNSIFTNPNAASLGSLVASPLTPATTPTYTGEASQSKHFLSGSKPTDLTSQQQQHFFRSNNISQIQQQF